MRIPVAAEECLRIRYLGTEAWARGLGGRGWIRRVLSEMNCAYEIRIVLHTGDLVDRLISSSANPWLDRWRRPRRRGRGLHTHANPDASHGPPSLKHIPQSAPQLDQEQDGGSCRPVSLCFLSMPWLVVVVGRSMYRHMLGMGRDREPDELFRDPVPDQSLSVFMR